MQSDFHFTPLENGLEFLLSSLEHLTQASSHSTVATDQPEAVWHQKRNLKYALLHLCSSIEVLFKVRLHQEHWSLVFANVNKADNDAQDAGEFDSVTFHDLIDRLIKICKVDISEEQRRQLINLRKRRNRMEHFGTVDSLPAISSSVSSMVSFIVDFVESTFTPEQLEKQRQLINQIRNKLGSCRAFIDHRWKEIRKDVEGFYSVIECPTCQQLALQVDGGDVRCRFCYYATTPKEAANEYILRFIGLAKYPPITCPECSDETLVLKTQGHGSFCFSCGENWASGELERCWDCNEFYVAQEDDAGICEDCYRARVEKD
jgi:hypothetical protein